MSVHESIPLNEDIQIEQALAVWISYKQQPANDADYPLLMVKGYDGDEENWTEIDYDEDDPSNFLDGTWTAAQLWSHNPLERGEAELEDIKRTFNIFLDAVCAFDRVLGTDCDPEQDWNQYSTVSDFCEKNNIAKPANS